MPAAGYGVLSVNFRGGSGYGDAHARMLIGDWGTFDMADVLQGVAVAVDRGLADGDRVASFGLSGGGYMTSWLLTHSDRFRAGVAGNLEVVQAQEAVALNDENLITSLYTLNVAKASLARAMGVAEQTIKTFLGGR